MSAPWQSIAWEDKMFWFLFKCGTIAALWCLTIVVLSQSSAILNRAKSLRRPQRKLYETLLQKGTPWRKTLMHFRLLFYLKVLGTKETVLADQQAEKKECRKKLVQKRCHQQPQSMMTTEHHYQFLSIFTVNRWKTPKRYVKCNCKL